MNRVQKLKLNGIASIINRLVILISGLILPRLILVYYGSDVNGLVATVSQYLSIITFLDLGVGAVVQSSLFKPLASNDESQISKIIKSASNYFRKIAYALIAYIVLLVLFFPAIVNNNLDHFSTALLIIAMSINIFAQYYFGIVNELLLNADQRAYVQLFSEVITVIINIVVNVLLITNGYSIVAVKLATGIIYLARPVFLKYYVDKNYNIDSSIELTEEPIKQKWYGIAQHVASIVLESTDTVVLSIFTSLERVSVYAVYSMVTTGIKLLISSLITGIKSFFGSLLASNEIEELKSYFTRIEWLIHTSVVFLFGMTSVLITPFVMLYTTGVEDANYYAPVFGVILSLAQALYSIRLPYNSLILAAGHFKETQTSAIIEVVINIVISLALVSRFGLIGVAVGTFAAMFYRSLYFAVYLSKNIIFRPIKMFLKHIFVDALIFSLYFIVSSFVELQFTSMLEWVFSAVVIGIIFILISIVINLIFYKDTTLNNINRLLKR